MASIRVHGAALIGLVLLCGVNFVDSAFCYKCTSDNEGEDCGIKVKLEQPKHHCAAHGEYEKSLCMTYQHMSTSDNSTVTVRDCPDKGYNCKTLYADGKNDSLLMCNECDERPYCNQNIDISQNTCVKCDSSLGEDCGDSIKDVGKNTCFLDSTVDIECVAYKYKQDSTTVTVRGCGRENTCETLRAGEYKDTLEMCHECSNTNGNNCNQNIPVSKTCVKCNSLEQPGCENGTIDTSTITGTCYLDDTVNTECITYKYEDASKSTIVTVRDCAPKDTCKSFLSDTYKETLVMCHECSSDTPNCNQNLEDLPTCVECNSLQDANCNKTKVDTSTTGVCYLDSFLNFECITYQYLEKDSSIVTVRGCAPEKNCEALHSGTFKDALVMCDECSDNSNCNQEFDTTETCIECNSEDDSDCQEITHISTTCFLDQTVKTKCITYQLNNENNQNVTYKGCAPPNQCSNLLSSDKSSLLMCDICTNTEDNPNCNQEIDYSETCIECNSEENPDCGNFNINPSITNATCYLDQTVKTECVVYKHQKDDKDKTEVTIRGCAPKDYCKSLLDDSLIMCNHCTGNNCNSEIHNSNKCVQCNSIDDPECGEDKVDTEKVHNTCDLDDTVNVQCVSYKYWQDGQTYIYRGCSSNNYCENAWSNTTACIVCSDSDENKMCNSEVNFGDEKILCIQCSSQDDEECGKDDMNSSKIKNYCPLDENNKECVGYKYLNPLNGEIETNRGCAPTNYCNVLNDNENTTVCIEGTKFISNKKIDTRTEKNLCVKCTGGEGSNCAAEEVDLIQVDFCSTSNTDENSCFVHKYLEASTGKMITERGCEASGYCGKQDKEYTAICKECKGEICNNKTDATNEKAFCVKCDGEEGTSECGNEKIIDLGQVGFCVLNSGVTCVAHRYLDKASGKIQTHRGCESIDYCSKSESTTIACQTCEENDKYCNQDIDEKDEKTLCVRCDSEVDGSECSEGTVDLSRVDFCGIVSTEDRQCVSHKYLNVKTNKFSTRRGCEPKDYCDQHNTTGTIICDECDNGNLCNKAIQSTDVTLCVQCNGDKQSDCSENTSDLSRAEFCEIDSANNKCIAYRHLDVTSGNITTYRGCEAESYCKKQNDSTKIMCYECESDNNCNMKIEADQEKTLCVACDGEACASNSLDLEQVGFCGLTSSDTKQCVIHRYLDVESGKINAHRGCESEKYCDQFDSNNSSIICDECKTDNLCNMIIAEEDALCVECSTDEGSACGADTITDFKQVNFCKINSSDKHQCVTHRYFNVTSGKISTYRGCEPDDYCDNQSNDSQIAMICSQCSNTDTICNIIIDTIAEKVNCIECTGEEGSNCANNTINLASDVQFCTLKENQQCFTHKYLDDKTHKINIRRGCENTNFCEKYKNEDNTLICDECQDEMCNVNTVNGDKFACVQCNGEEESECGNNTVDLAKVDTCVINSKTNQQCVSHKYLDVSTGKITTYRGCGIPDYCEQHSKVDNGSTALCMECNDSDHCNMNIDTSEQLTLCIECVGEEGSECAAATSDLTKMSFCGISKKNKKECMSYRYMEDSTNKLKTVRGCEKVNCSTLVIDDGKLQQCSECSGDVCNYYLEIITTTTIPPSTTCGAASIIQYKIDDLFLYLILSVLFLVLTKPL